jgi:hypothetical protein
MPVMAQRLARRWLDAARKGPWWEEHGYKIYKVARPFEMLGLPSHLKWAVSKNGNFEEAFRTKRNAIAYVEKWTKQGY